MFAGARREPSPGVGQKNGRPRNGDARSLSRQKNAYTAARRCTLPALRHDVQALTRLGVPFTIARTR